MEYQTINAKGERQLREWLENRLKANLFADRFVEHITSEYDGSQQGQIEVSGFHTASGNPEIYVFDDDELNTHQIED